jgi:hypothetical protein
VVAASISLEDGFAAGPPLRLVLSRAKRERVAARAARFGGSRPCSVPTCEQQGLPVVLVEAELDAILCPRHELVLPDGSPVIGQPVLATSAW